MKSLQEYITESLVNEKFTERDWRNKYISFGEMVKFAKDALAETKVKPRAICAELGNYEDPDDLWNAYDQGNLSDTKKWMEKFTEMLSETDEYGGKEGDIADALFDDLYDLMDQIDRKKL